MIMLFMQVTNGKNCKCYIVPKAVAKFAKVVHVATRLDCNIRKSDLLPGQLLNAKLPQGDTAFTMISGVVQDKKSLVDKLWDIWQTNYIALHTVVTTITKK